MRKDTPLISIIIPVYNVKNYLREALATVCGQTYQNLEIILIDDGSTDGSGQLCDICATEDNRIKVIHKKNGGVGSARNVGLDAATGEYIAFVDSDDFIEKETIEVLLQAFDKYPDLGIICASPVYRYSEGRRRVYKEFWNIKEERLSSPKQFCVGLLKYQCNSMVWGKLYKRELFNQIRFWEEICGDEDTLLMYELTFILEKMRLNILELPLALYTYRYSPGSITNHKIIALGVDSLKNIERMMQATTDEEILNTLKSKYYYKLYAFYIHLLFEAGELGEEMRQRCLKQYHAQLKKENLWDVYKKCSYKLAIKYFLGRNKTLYYHLYKWTLYKQYQKSHNF